MKSLFVAALSMALAISSTQAQSPGAPQEEVVATPDVPQIVAASNQDKQWRPTTEQQKRVLRDALAYLTAKDTGQFAAAYAFFTSSQKSAVSFNRWEADMRAFYGGAGSAGGRTLKKVTWYKNPLNAPAGIYAAVDFSSQFTELSLHCGFVAMQIQMDGSFGVAREEENSIPKREMARLTPETLQRIRAEFRC